MPKQWVLWVVRYRDGAKLKQQEFDTEAAARSFYERKRKNGNDVQLIKLKPEGAIKRAMGAKVKFGRKEFGIKTVATAVGAALGGLLWVLMHLGAGS
jgi:hypothetical protein